MENRDWIWFFTGLGVLGTLAIAIPLVFNLRQQLKPEQVAVARALWNERGPRDYELDYVERVDIEQQTDEYHVEVRDGKVEIARRNGLETTDAVFTVDGMFDLIEKNLAMDQSAGRGNYTVAVFAADDGRPLRYVRRIRGSNERLEWRVRLKAAAGR